MFKKEYEDLKERIKKEEKIAYIDVNNVFDHKEFVDKLISYTLKTLNKKLCYRKELNGIITIQLLQI